MKLNKWLEGLLIFCFLAVGSSLTDFASECTAEAKETALFAFIPLTFIAVYGYITRFRFQEDNKKLRKQGNRIKKRGQNMPESARIFSKKLLSKPA
ncbi:hypothetical protein [[Limnothrix rosea] IAM M-220]|uniref:hypothetical protein n=1 Tax=[Limnothrix rosea] IAM M-220 TaxID=454133 RepID=UPI0009602CDF|nr:hypothetical protein [[Limnothrix rosea] IAM M-220]OKH18157.1 hypothetical protein NIES208_06430 [[Limnothrix rosea] IAM M-220]